MRTLSQAIKDVLAQEYAETKDVVIITIPPQQGDTVYSETVLYLANGEGIFIDGHNYENKLRQIGEIKFSLGKAPDNAEISIENVSRSLGFTLTDFERSLDGAKVEIKRAFKVSGGIWEADSVFIGQVRDVKVDQEAISISLNSDMSRRGTTVAGRPLTQRCILKFNVNGSGVGPICGWKIGMPGDATSCDRGLDTANGCQAHGNQHRFGGVPPFTAIDTGNGYDYNGGGWGEGSGGGWCIAIDSYVLVEYNGLKSWIKAYDIKQGDRLISIDKFGHFVPTTVVKATVGNTTTLYSLSTEKGYSLSSSPTHRIMKDHTHNEGVAVNTFEENDEVLVYDFKSHEHFKDKITGIETIKRTSLVLMLELTEPYHLFMAGNEKNGAIVSHNNKPIYTDRIGIGGTGYDFWNTNNWGYVNPSIG